MGLSVYLLLGLLFIDFRSGGADEGSPRILSCFSEDKDAAATCEPFVSVSSSPFVQGQRLQNVVNITKNVRFLVLRCEASYPIQWLTQRQKPSRLSTKAEVARGNLTKTKFIQEVVGNRWTINNRALRCQSYVNSSIFSEVYIVGGGRDASRTRLEQNVRFLVVGNEGGSQSGGSSSSISKLTMPCVGTGLGVSMKLVKTGRMSKILNQITDECVECLCYANTETCNRFPVSCDNTNEVCGKPRPEFLIADNDTCYSNATCAKSLIEDFMRGSSESVKECSLRQSDLMTCETYAKVLFRGLDSCEPEVGRNSGSEKSPTDLRITKCLHELTESAKTLSVTKYDPRIGFEFEENPDLTSVYSCYSPESSDTTSIIPLSFNGKQHAEIYYVQGNQSGITCQLQNPMEGIQLRFRECISIPDCDLKFQSISLLSLAKSASGSQVVSDGGDKRFLAPAPNMTHGFVECSGYTESSNGSGGGPLEFVRETDYLFTGLNKRKYLVSQPLPEEAVISVTNNNVQPLKTGITYTFDCSISTFVLYPNITFMITNSTSKMDIVVQNGILGTSVNELTRSSPASTICNWQLQIRLTPEITNVICMAPWLHKEGWVKSSVNVSAEEPLSERSWSTGATVGVVFAVIVVITLVAVILGLWRKNQLQAQMIRDLTEEEIEEFHKGTSAKSADGTCAVENMAFKDEKRIPRDRLITNINDEILGEGEFGIVSKGFYNDEAVAVKKTKSNADVDYFKAFLKEIKVMAFLGEHDNIVKFYGAVVDQIKERMCLAVIELSLFGNLNEFLRKFAHTYSNTAVGIEALGESSESGIVRLNRQILTRFCRQIAGGMAYLTSKNVIHGDLAARNVLVFDGCIAKITDFGLSKQLYGCANYVKNKQTPLPWRWMALETLRYLEFSTQSDVWSFGVTVWEVFSLAQVPFSGVTWTTEFVEEIEAGTRLPRPNLASTEVYNAMLRCWERDPKDRPTFSDLERFFREEEDFEPVI